MSDIPSHGLQIVSTLSPDGTLVIDLKPYVSRFDGPDKKPRCGWFDDVAIESDRKSYQPGEPVELRLRHVRRERRQLQQPLAGQCDRFDRGRFGGSERERCHQQRHRHC